MGNFLKIGEATVNNQLAACSAVSTAAVVLLTANPTGIVSLQALAAPIGVKAEDVAE